MDDDAFLANVTEFLTENDEQLDLSSLPAIGDDVILDADTMVLLPSDVAQPDGRKGRREVRNTKVLSTNRKEIAEKRLREGTYGSEWHGVEEVGIKPSSTNLNLARCYVDATNNQLP
ncbi:hypothetical protein DVH05_028592 [Phytophthora capsici]|nr:hypothetical protein DVH05_028526 [Phytophthora capsici]KAG1701804.1 hypothetical protein DVH05_028568 [Phytophthora capsici]KAG1710885.1 hypothetical protein DVH05_028592 [Phytophthora capsici]